MIGCEACSDERRRCRIVPTDNLVPAREFRKAMEDQLVTYAQTPDFACGSARRYRTDGGITFE
jgi:hypothetical protein